MPYARFLQAARVSAEQEAEEALEETRRAAFIGWLVAGSIGFSEVPPLMRWFEQLGLSPDKSPAELSPEEIEAEKKRAFENAQRALEAFRKGGVKQHGI